MDKDVFEVSPEDLASLDDLGRLLEQYQTYLIAGHAFADAARAQASNASGTARPALERLRDARLGEVPRLESALRILRTDEDRKAVLEEVEPALKDLRALIAVARRHRHAPTISVANLPAPPAIATPPAAPAPATHPPLPARSRTWLWVGAALVVGLILGAFGTELPRSAGFLSRLWVLLEPVVAAGSGGVLGELLLREGLMDTIRKRWPTMLVCSILLIATAPTAVDAALELVRSGPTATAPPAQQSAPASPAAVSVKPPERPQPPASSPAGTVKQPVQADDAPAHTPAPVLQSRSSGPAPAAGSPARGRPAGSAPVTANPPAQSAECEQLLLRYTLGELTDREKTILANDCRKK